MNIGENAAQQLSILEQSTAEVLPADGLRQKIETAIKENRPLRVKLGIDPTTSDVHIGHMVPYRKLRQFQDLGHTAVLIIGDFTAMIGDPTGKNRERPRLTFEQVKANTGTYCSQIFKVIDETKAEIHYQSSWFAQTSLEQTIEMAAEFSVAHLLSHETFRSRIDSGERLSLHELFYPLLQAWDSLQIRADIEIGGMDQKFNILCGRDLQRNTGVEPQTALFLPLLPGTDGKKMSKTGGNSINVLDPPEQMYGKVMSLPDGLLPEYISLASSLRPEATEEPYALKKRLAKHIVETYHGSASAIDAETYFRKTVSDKQIPDDIPCVNLLPGEYPIVGLITENGLASSASEARRLILQGGIRINGERIADIHHVVSITSALCITLQAGKRKYMKFECR